MIGFRYTDPVLRSLRLSYIRARAQAKYRNETWALPWEIYLDLWLTDQRYKRKGRGADQLHLSRQDITGPWTPENVHVVTRAESGSSWGWTRRYERK